MADLTSVIIANVGYRSTNYWVISAGASRFLVDIGWSGTLGVMKANLSRMDMPLHEIRFALATPIIVSRSCLMTARSSSAISRRKPLLSTTR
jgi:hypothetical protein